MNEQKKILICPDKFKDCLDLDEIHQIISVELKKKNQNLELISYYLSDGGENFVFCNSKNKNGKLVEIKYISNRLDSELIIQGFIDDKNILFLEYSSICGLTLKNMREIDLKDRSSSELADIIKVFITKYQPKEIILGIGGSSTQDFGIDFYKRANEIQLPKIKITIYSDVETKLKDIFLFGEQKGMLNSDLNYWKLRKNDAIAFYKDNEDIVFDDSMQFLGASGGIYLGLKSYFKNIDIELTSKIILEELACLENVYALITGEGCLDMGSLEGKGPYYLAQNIKNTNRKIFISGNIKCDKNILDDSIELYNLYNENLSLNENIQNTSKNLERTIRELKLL